MSDLGTMFPSLEGDSPGDEPSTEDITNRPLERGLPPIPDSDVGKNRQHIGIHSDPGIPDMPGGGGGEESESYAPSAERQKPNRLTARERIGQLTRQRNEERDRGAELERTVKNLQEKVQSYESRMSQAPQPQQVSHQYGEREPQSYGDLSPSTPPATSGIGANDLRKIVAEAVAPIYQRFEAIDRQTSLRQEQGVAFREATKVLPELNDPESDEALAFAELIGTPSYRNAPDGPLHAAYVVKGVFAEEKSARTEQAARKRGASVVQVGPSPKEAGLEMPTRRYDEIITEGLKRAREGTDNTDDYIAVRRSQRERARRSR